MSRKIEISPDIHQNAALALLGLLSNPQILKTDSQLTNGGLQILTDAAFRAAYLLEHRLLEARKASTYDEPISSSSNSTQKEDRPIPTA